MNKNPLTVVIQSNLNFPNAWLNDRAGGPSVEVSCCRNGGEGEYLVSVTDGANRSGEGIADNVLEALIEAVKEIRNEMKKYGDSPVVQRHYAKLSRDLKTILK